MRTVWLLAVAQALSAAGMMTMFVLGVIVGSRLAPSPQLATLPLSLVIVGLALATVPAALAMQRFGRRRTFIASVLLAAAAALAVAWAIVILELRAALRGIPRARREPRLPAAAALRRRRERPRR